MRNVVCLSSPELWKRGFGPNHPLKPDRLQRTYELLDEMGALKAPNVQVIEPRTIEENELALFHTQEYISAVRSMSKGEHLVRAYRFGFGPGDNPIFAGMFEISQLKVSSSLKGAKMLVNNECDVAFSYSGGLHHAGPDFASFSSESDYIDRTAPDGPLVVLHEKADVRVSGFTESPASGYFLDIAITHRCATEHPVEIVKYRYSGFN